MNQADLFTELTPNPIARGSDPDTSHDAAEALTASGRRAALMMLVLAAVRETPGLTARELASHHKIDHPTVHKRLSDLRAKGMVFNPPDGNRRCMVSGRECMVWTQTTEEVEGE